MKVYSNQLIDGCILAEDVFSLTNQPVVPKKTILSDKTLEIIHAFLIKEVHVEPTLVTGEPFNAKEIIENIETDVVVEENPIEDIASIYLKAVQAYKKQYKGWQSGITVNMPIIREIIVPVIEKALEKPSDIFTLHHYSTANDYIYHHAITLAALSAVLAKKLNFQKGDCIQIGLAGALSDCGMAKIDPKILNKTGPLSRDEFEEVKKHPVYSYLMVKDIKYLKDNVKKAVYKHHERIDGSGYPNGISSDYLFPYERIISVADVYHAMTSERNYRSKQSPFKVLESILEDQFGKFDMKVVHALTKVMTSFSTGTKVRLSNSQIGTIVFIEPKSPTRPMIKLEGSEDIIQLINYRDLYIEEIL